MLELVSLQFYESIFSTLKKETNKNICKSRLTFFVRLSLYIWIQYLKQQCGMEPALVLSTGPVSFVCTLVC